MTSENVQTDYNESFAWPKIIHKNEIVVESHIGTIVVVAQAEYTQMMKKVIKANLNRKEHRKRQMCPP